MPKLFTPVLVTILVSGTPLFGQRCDHCTKDGIEMPVSLAKGTITTPEFFVKRSEQYNMLLDVRWLLPTDDLRCKMGFALASSDHDCKIDSLIQISWKVLDGNQIVAEGVDSGRSPAFDANGHSLIRHIGHFRGKAKHGYIVEVTFTKDASELNVTEPYLIVEAPDSW